MKMMFLLLGSLLLPFVAQAEVVEVDNQQLKQLLNDGIPIVDIRTASEWKETGIVEGSNLLTFFDAAGNYDARSWLARLASIAGKEDPVILICRTGRRTCLISKFIDQQIGYHKVYNVSRGIRDWIDKKNPVVAP